MRGKKLIFALIVISASVFLGIISRFMTELHFNSNEESYAFHENDRDIAAGKKVNEETHETHEEIEGITLTDFFSNFPEDNIEIELSPPARNQRSTERSAPARSQNEDETIVDLSEYHITSRRMDKSDIIPYNNAPTSGVIRPDKNRPPVKDMYLREETRRSNITIPIESVDIKWIKRIWE